MFEKKCVPSKLIIALLIVMLLLGQTYVGSFGADTSSNSSPGPSTIANFLKIEKTIKKANTSTGSPDKYVLGELINVHYLITGDKIPFNVPKEIVFVIDLTSSMSTWIDKDKKVSRLDSLKGVFREFLKYWDDPSTKISIVTFAPKAEVVVSLREATASNIANVFIPIVDGWNNEMLNDKEHKGTNLGDGLRTAYYELDKGHSSAKKYIITLTDGMPTMRTINKEGKTHSIKETVKGNTVELKNDPLNLDDLSKFNEYQTNAINYSCDIMGEIAGDRTFTNFLIGFGIDNTQNQANTMNRIGQAGGVSSVGDVNGDGNTDYFYRPTSGSELTQVFNDIYRSMQDTILFETASLFDEIPNGIQLSDNPFEGIDDNDTTLTSTGKSQIVTAPNKLTIPLNIKLKRAEGPKNEYVMDPDKVEFYIQFIVTKTGEITFPPPTGEFVFVDPVEGGNITLSPITEEKKLYANQSVDSVIIPPMIVFAGSKSQAEAVVNPKTGLEVGDDAINNWGKIDALQKIGDLSQSVDSDHNIIAVEDGVKKDNFANITAFAGDYGVQTVVANSLGYAFGGNGPVIGKGRIISILPEVKPITIKLAETKDASITLSEDQTDYLGDRVKKIMDEYYFNQMNFVDDTSDNNAFNNAEFKLYPKGSGYYLGYKEPFTGDMGFTSVTIGSNPDSSSGSNGNWILDPRVIGGTRNYLIRNGGDNSGFLVSSSEGNKAVYSHKLVNPIGLNLWKIDLMEDGYFRITSKKTGKSLTFDNSSNTFSSEFYAGSQGQKWKFEKQGTKEPSGVPAKLEDIIDKIEFESDGSGNPTAKADEPNAVRIAFGNEGDRTRLKITGIRPTKLDSKPLGDGKITITTNVIYKNISYKNSKPETKATLTFDVIIEDIVDIN